MASNLTWQDEKDALRSLLVITENRNGDIKAKQVAFWSKQRTYDRYDKSDGSAPTVMTDSVIITGVIDAKERRAVAVVDVRKYPRNNWTRISWESSCPSSTPSRKE